MNETLFETAQEAAERLGVTVRAIQKWAAAGKLPGAIRHGKMWLIPKGAEPPDKLKTKDKSEQPQGNGIPDVYQLTPFRVAMPLLNSAYPVGKCMEYIEAMPDKDDRAIALGEYYFFSGRSDEAARVVAEYQDSHDPSLRFSANLIATFANLAGGHTHLTRFAMGNLQEQVRVGLRSDAPPQLHAIGIFTATAASVLLHLPLPQLPPLEDFLRYLPEGLKLYACYILAHKAYLDGDYSRSLAIADMGLAMCPEVFPIPFVYCHIFAAIALMNLKRTEEAMARVEKAWAIAEPDELLQPFAEHHGLLHGLVENFFKEKHPETHKRIDSITYAFSAGWRAVHNPDTKHEVAGTLTTLEFTIAMLWTREWSADEIGDHLGISERTVYNRIDIIYSKLGIMNEGGSVSFNGGMTVIDARGGYSAVAAGSGIIFKDGITILEPSDAYIKDDGEEICNSDGDTDIYIVIGTTPPPPPPCLKFMWAAWEWLTAHIWQTVPPPPRPPHLKAAAMRIIRTAYLPSIITSMRAKDIGTISISPQLYMLPSNLRLYW